MRILALDIASTTGWAHNFAGEIKHGTWNLKPARGSSPGMRYLKLQHELRRACSSIYPDKVGMIAYEQAHHQGGAATEYALGCVGTIQAFCAMYEIEHVAIHSASIKKSATGNGRASKADMIVAAEKLLGHKVGDDNEADAVHLLAHTLSKFDDTKQPAGALK